MMHPLVSAYAELREIRLMAIRRESPYYQTWLRMLREQHSLIEELSRCP